MLQLTVGDSYLVPSTNSVITIIDLEYNSTGIQEVYYIIGDKPNHMSFMEFNDTFKCIKI